MRPEAFFPGAVCQKIDSTDRFILICFASFRQPTSSVSPAAPAGALSELIKAIWAHKQQAGGSREEQKKKWNVSAVIKWVD